MADLDPASRLVGWRSSPPPTQVERAGPCRQCMCGRWAPDHLRHRPSPRAVDRTRLS
jgi:hypothetical protein